MRLACIILLCFAATASAADMLRPGGYPERQVEIIVPFSRGGGMDVTMRILARHAEKELGQHIHVNNLTTGGNIQGNITAINAVPDGTIWCAWGNGLVTDEFIVRNAPYTYHDVRPVCMVSRDPHVIAVGAEFAAENSILTLGDLLEFVRNNPGRVVFGSGGNWTTHDFIRLKMEEAVGAPFVRMPFLGGRPAAQAAAEGNCDVVTPILPEYMPYLDDGRLIPLAIAYPERAPQLPDLPTTVEEGYPDLLQSIWRVVAVPKDTPDAIAGFIETVLYRTMANEEFCDAAIAAGVTPAYMGSADLQRFLEQEHRFFAEKTAAWGIKIDR